MSSAEVLIYEVYRLLENYYLKRKTVESFFEYFQIKTFSAPIDLVFKNSSREKQYGEEISKKVEKVFKTMNLWKLFPCKRKQKYPIKTKTHMIRVQKKIKNLWKKPNPKK